MDIFQRKNIMFDNVFKFWTDEEKINSVLKKSAYYMSMVYLNATQSEDPDTKIGCVIVGPDKEIRSTGYNGLPRGVKITPEKLQRPEKYYWFHHAEENALNNAARAGTSTNNCFLYVNAMPCENCARAIIQSGIKYVIVHDKFVRLTLKRWKTSIERVKEMFKEANVKLYTLEDDFKLTTNLVGYFDGEMVNLN